MLTNSKHEGETTGTSIKIGSIDAYVAEPTGKNIHKNTAILFLPDVIGIWQNSQLMADQFAANVSLILLKFLIVNMLTYFTGLLYCYARYFLWKVFSHYFVVNIY